MITRSRESASRPAQMVQRNCTSGTQVKILMYNQSAGGSPAPRSPASPDRKAGLGKETKMEQQDEFGGIRIVENGVHTEIYPVDANGKVLVVRSGVKSEYANAPIAQAARDLVAKRIGFGQFKRIVRENS